MSQKKLKYFFCHNSESFPQQWGPWNPTSTCAGAVLFKCAPARVRSKGPWTSADCGMLSKDLSDKQRINQQFAMISRV